MVSLLACCDGGDRMAGGNSSEVGNGMVAGLVRNPDGTLATGVLVLALPVDYRPPADGDPDTLRYAYTDNSGEYSFSDMPLYSYNIQASRGTLAALVDSVALEEPSTAVTAPDAVLEQAGAVTGVAFIEGHHTQSNQLDIYLAGTPWRMGRTDLEADSTFLIGGVAPGRYRLIVAPYIAGHYQYEFDIAIAAADTLRVDTIRVGPIAQSSTPIDDLPRERLTGCACQPQSALTTCRPLTLSRSHTPCPYRLDYVRHSPAGRESR